jgi:NUDIX domain
MPSLLLRVLKLAHALQRLLLAVSTARNALLQRMISCLPALLSHTLARGWRGRGVAMVATRATAARRGRAETLQHVVERLSGLSNVDREPLSDKHAAVLCALFQDEDGVVRVWLTQRAMHLNSHQGEVCLPGGKRDAEDVDDAATAVREAQEELALPPADVRVLCSLQPFLSKHLYSVVPVVATVRRPQCLPRLLSLQQRCL